MKSFTILKFALLSIVIGLLLTVISGMYGKSKAFTIHALPEYCMGPDVVGYECPEISAKATGFNRGFPFAYRYEMVTIPKQEGFIKPKTLNTAPLSFKNFVLDWTIWTLVIGSCALTIKKLRPKLHNN